MKNLGLITFVTIGLTVIFLIVQLQLRSYNDKLLALYQFYEVSIDLAKQTDEYNQKVITYNQQVAKDQKQQIVK